MKNKKEIKYRRVKIKHRKKRDLSFVFLVLAFLFFFGVLIFLFNLTFGAPDKLTLSIKGKGGFLYSIGIVTSQDKIPQNTYLQITINPGSKGISNTGYIYDSNGNLKTSFQFDCSYICYEEKTTEVFIGNLTK